MDLLTFLGYIVLIMIILFIIFFTILAFTTGFRRSGRLMGGLFALIGRPGEGKSYCATHIGLKGMIVEKRRVFSNFAIVSVDGKYSSLVINGQTEDKIIDDIHFLMSQNLNRAILILDEAHLYFWSRDFKNFTKEDKDFFTFLSQHEISCYYIVQHEDRMDTVANDCANLFGIVHKFEIPILNMPLFFVIEWWASEDEMKNAIFHPEIKPFLTERIWFNLDVANAYDTRAFGHSMKDPYEGITWIEFYKKYKGIDWTPPEHISLGRIIRNSMSRRFRKMIKFSSFTKDEGKRAIIHHSDKIQYVLSALDNPMIRNIISVYTFVYWSFRVYYYLVLVPSLRERMRKYKGLKR